MCTFISLNFTTLQVWKQAWDNQCSVFTGWCKIISILCCSLSWNSKCTVPKHRGFGSSFKVFQKFLRLATQAIFFLSLYMHRKKSCGIMLWIKQIHWTGSWCGLRKTCVSTAEGVVKQQWDERRGQERARICWSCITAKAFPQWNTGLSAGTFHLPFFNKYFSFTI